jgi:hypothetical protein
MVGKVHKWTLSNQKTFLDNLWKECNISRPKDWGKITLETVVKKGGSGLLARNSDSLFHALRANYPQVQWQRGWFSLPRNYWSDRKKHREFLEEIAKEFSINQDRDWGRISVHQIHER